MKRALGAIVAVVLTAAAWNCAPVLAAGYPDIPTIGESIPGYAIPDGWLGFFGPAGLPAPIVKRINTESLKALYAPDIRAKLEAAGMVVKGASAEEFAAVVKAHIEAYRKLTIAAGIKPE